MKLKTVFYTLLATATLFAAVSCNGEEKKNSNDFAVDTNDEYLKDILIEDYEGYDFRILTRKGMSNDQYVEEETGNLVDDAVFRRNETVKQLLNIDISVTETSVSGSETEALSSILAGDDQYDMILTHSRSAFQYATQNTVINYNEVETLHLDKPWWNQDIVDSCNVNGHLYVIDGDIQTHSLNYSMCLFFNKRIFDELGIEYPYQKVRDGKWTFDEFEKLVKRGTKDMNGDGIISPEHDRYGFVTSDWQSPISFLYSTGQRIYSKDANGIPQLTLNSSKTVDFFNKYFDLVATDDVLLLTFGNNPSGFVKKIYGPSSDFKSGYSMFQDSGLGSAMSLRSMSDDFGILPIPKFTEEDEYATVINGHASLVLMPITVEDENRTGNIMEALCAVGSKEVVPAFYDVSLKTKFSRDTESEEMLDIIKDSIIYDLGYVSGGTFESIGYNLAHSDGVFSARYASYESSALYKLKEFNKAYGKIG